MQCLPSTFRQRAEIISALSEQRNRASLDISFGRLRRPKGMLGKNGERFLRLSSPMKKIKHASFSCDRVDCVKMDFFRSEFNSHGFCYCNYHTLWGILPYKVRMVSKLLQLRQRWGWFLDQSGKIGILAHISLYCKSCFSNFFGNMFRLFLIDLDNRNTHPFTCKSGYNDETESGTYASDESSFLSQSLVNLCLMVTVLVRKNS